MYLYLTFGIISFIASIIGSICGVGGGVLIKPTLDTFGVLSVSSISFLSGCTVLTMASYSIIKSNISGDSLVDKKVGIPLALGSAIGGIVGKILFQQLTLLFSSENKVGAVQSICLVLITTGTLVYMLNKEKINTYKVEKFYICVAIGLLLGILSAFLGIGGGPINLVVLYFFFSMDTKIASQNSLYIILFSQITSLISTVLTNSVPKVDLILLIIMVSGGFFGGLVGRKINNIIDSNVVEKLFNIIMVVIILISVFNTFKFL